MGRPEPRSRPDGKGSGVRSAVRLRRYSARSGTGRPSGGLAQGLGLARVRQALERPPLDLTHPLAREAELPADLVERLGLVPAQTEAQAKDPGVALGKLLQRSLQELGAQAHLEVGEGLVG